MNFLFWKESEVGRQVVTNIKRGGKNESQDKKKNTCSNNFGSNRFKLGGSRLVDCEMTAVESDLGNEHLFFHQAPIDEGYPRDNGHIPQNLIVFVYIGQFLQGRMK
jgi:hypothetical protein